MVKILFVELGTIRKLRYINKKKKVLRIFYSCLPIFASHIKFFLQNGQNLIYFSFYVIF